MTSHINHPASFHHAHIAALEDIPEDLHNDSQSTKDSD